uniref:Uncharacterized protein n=1 Tax=Rhizophora mucronata TaxID=61149 RepID=A0A2P2QFI9_RHIMU
MHEVNQKRKENPNNLFDLRASDQYDILLLNMSSLTINGSIIYIEIISHTPCKSFPICRSML